MFSGFRFSDKNIERDISNRATDKSTDRKVETKRQKIEKYFFMFLTMALFLSFWMALLATDEETTHSQHRDRRGRLTVVECIDLYESFHQNRRFLEEGRSHAR